MNQGKFWQLLTPLQMTQNEEGAKRFSDHFLGVWGKKTGMLLLKDWTRCPCHCPSLHRCTWGGAESATPPTFSPWPASSAPWSSTDLSRRGQDLFLAFFLHSTPPTRRSNSILAGNYNSRVESSANGKFHILGMCIVYPSICALILIMQKF